MMDSPQHQTILFIRKKVFDATSGKQLRKAIVSLAPEEVGKRFGHWTIQSTEIQRGTRHQDIYVLCRCDCGREDRVYAWNLIKGKSTQCKRCQAWERHAREGKLIVKSRIVASLQKRVNAMCQRCTNPNDLSYHNYGGRGIQFRFGSVVEAVNYILKELPHKTYDSLDIDRIDNDGHYEPGNLRLCSRSENLSNRRTKRAESYQGKMYSRKELIELFREHFPQMKYADSTIKGFLVKGLTADQIIKKWHERYAKPTM